MCLGQEQKEKNPLSSCCWEDLGADEGFENKPGNVQGNPSSILPMNASVKSDESRVFKKAGCFWSGYEPCVSAGVGQEQGLDMGTAGIWG